MPDKAKPENIILIGAMKCGTTSLYDHLKNHPDFCAALVKEPEYFSVKMGNPKYKSGAYEALFPKDYSDHPFMLEASTGYAKYPAEEGVPKRIHAYGLNPYFIYIVRNPFDRIESHFNFMKKDPSWKTKIDAPHLMHTSNYYMQLKEYESFFDKERILVLDFETLKTNPSEICDKVYTFVGASDFQFPNTFAVKNVTQPVNRKKVQLKARFGRIARFIPAPIKNQISVVLNKMYPPEMVKLTASQRERIQNQLAPNMKLLHENYGVDVAKWGFD